MASGRNLFVENQSETRRGILVCQHFVLREIPLTKTKTTRFDDFVNQLQPIPDYLVGWTVVMVLVVPLPIVGTVPCLQFLP